MGDEGAVVVVPTTAHVPQQQQQQQHQHHHPSAAAAAHLLQLLPLVAEGLGQVRREGRGAVPPEVPIWRGEGGHLVVL